MFGKGLGKIESKRVSPFKLLKFHNVSNTTVLSKGSHTTLFRNRRNGYDVSLSLSTLRTVLTFLTLSLSLSTQYTSGILSKGCDGAIDHAVLVTGFGSAGGVDYWTIKNRLILRALLLLPAAAAG